MIESQGSKSPLGLRGGLEANRRIVLGNVFLSLILFGGELPDGARLSARFAPARVMAGGKTALEISVTPPPGAVLLAFAQPKSLGAPVAIDLEPGPLTLAGPLEEPAVLERP